MSFGRDLSGPAALTLCWTCESPVPEANPWTVLSSTKLYENDHLAIVEHEVRDPAGEEASYTVAHFRRIGLRILPVDDQGCTVLVGQYRFAAGFYSWELPAGGREKTEPARVGAERELREETGLVARHWLELPHLIPSGSITDERQHLFLAWGLAAGEGSPDPQEVLRTRRVSVAEGLRMVRDGEIADAGTVAAFLMADLKARHGHLPDDVARHFR